MTSPLTPEALVEKLARHLAEEHVRGTDREDDFDWSAITDQALRMSFIRAARRIFGGPLAPLLAAHQQVTAERDEDRAEHARYRASAEEMWETAKRHGGRMLAEKRRADIAEASLATANAELARLRAEGEALKEELAAKNEALRVGFLPAGPFADWSDASLSAQCRMQARSMLDPEMIRFFTALADRLDARTALARAATAREG